MNSFRRPFLTVLSIALLIAAGISTAAAQAPSEAVPKNIILMIADGCGFNHVACGDCYENGACGSQHYEQTFTPLALSTYPAGGGYDPAANWATFSAPKEKPTDSAAAGTALSTGVKTYNGRIELGPDNARLTGVEEVAEKAGKATGVVTTVPLSHATPACFIAHCEERGNYADIAHEMFASGAEVIMGCGHPDYDNDGKLLPPVAPEDKDSKAAKKRYYWVGDPDSWNQVISGQPLSPIAEGGPLTPWTFIESKEAFQDLADGKNLPPRVLGVPRVHETLQADRAGHDDNERDDAPSETPFLDTVPDLATMAKGALNVLSQTPDGFFLMIEGGAIDWASHGNGLGRMIEEVTSFNHAVEAVEAWVETHGGWNETLVVITADHETGYLTGPNSDPDWNPIQCNGAGKLPGAEWHHRGHTNNLVPCYVRGAGAANIEALATNQDPKRGRYLDNAALGQELKKLAETKH